MQRHARPHAFLKQIYNLQRCTWTHAYMHTHTTVHYLFRIFQSSPKSRQSGWLQASYHFADDGQIQHLQGIRPGGQYPLVKPAPCPLVTVLQQSGHCYLQQGLGYGKARDALKVTQHQPEHLGAILVVAVRPAKTNLGHSHLTSDWVIHIQHQTGSLIPNTRLGHSHPTPDWVTHPQHQTGSLTPNTRLGHSHLIPQVVLWTSECPLYSFAKGRRCHFRADFWDGVGSHWV